MAVVASEGFLGLLHPARPSNSTSFNLIIRSKKQDLKSPSLPSSSSSSSKAPNFWPFSISTSPSPIPSLLKAVQFTGAGQSLSSVSRQALLLLDLPYILINEIKKRVSLPFLEDGQEEIREDIEIPAENQSAATDNSLAVGESIASARCAPWPGKDPSHLINQAMETSNNSSANFTSTSVLAEMAVINSSICTLERERQVVNIIQTQGPRCAWPREIKHGLMMQATNGNSGQGEAVMQAIEGGAKCAWPRVINGKAQSSSMMTMMASNSATNSDQARQERVIEGGAKCAWPRLNGKAQSSSSSVNACAAAEQHAKKKEAAAMVEGPRCAWPRAASSSSSMTPCDPSKSCSKSLHPPEDF